MRIHSLYRLLRTQEYRTGAEFSNHEAEVPGRRSDLAHRGSAALSLYPSVMDLRRYYYLNQVEHAQNIIFKRNHSIHSIVERSCDLGLARITVQRIANIFGWRITKRTKGKHQVVLDQMEHGHHILRAYSKNAFVKQYEKDNTFLRIETCSNNLKDFRQKKGLEHLPQVADKLQAVNDRFADAQAEDLNVEIDYPLLETLDRASRQPICLCALRVRTKSRRHARDRA